MGLTKKAIKTISVISTPIHLFLSETGEKSSCTELETGRFLIPHLFSGAGFEMTDCFFSRFPFRCFCGFYIS